MATLTRLAAGDDPAPVLDTLDTDGGVIVTDVFPPDVIRQIVDDLRPTYDGTAPGSRDDEEMWHVFHGEATKRFTGLAARSRAFVDHVLLNPLLLAVADAQLLPHGADYWLNTGQVMAIGPGEPAQVLHRDEGNWPEARRPDAELTVSAMIALSPFTAENGATVTYPGSHRVDPNHTRSSAEVDLGDPAFAAMPAGSAMIYSGKLLHGAGQNRTDAWRYGLHISYVVGWLRPEEASPLMVDRELAASLPARARELLGWGSYRSHGGGRTWLVDFEDAAQLFS
ncbi:MAG: phytanoyl-CoA dioxygenase family protein [Actinomycetota bacterium]